MGQPYPPNAAYSPHYVVTPERPLPPAVRRAVLFMRIGAALAMLTGLANVVDALLSGQDNNGNHADSGAAFRAGYVGGYLVLYLVPVGLWLWMAKANSSGKNWARVTGTVFFGISCLLLPNSLLTDANADDGQGGGLVYVAMAATVLAWIIGLGTVILLWQKRSTPHFTPAPTWYPGPGPGGYFPMMPSNAPMDAVPQQQPMADPWSTPSSD